MPFQVPVSRNVTNRGGKALVDIPLLGCFGEHMKDVEKMSSRE